MHHRVLRTFDDVFIPFVGSYTSGVRFNYIGRLSYAQDDPTALTTAVPTTTYDPVSWRVKNDYTKVAYVVQGPTTVGDIYTVSANGGDEAVIYDGDTAGSGGAYEVAWIGEKILFGTLTPNIYRIDADGSNQVTLYTDGSSRNIANIGVNYDDSMISFQTLNSSTVRGNWTMNSDGSGAVQVSTSPTQFSGLYDQRPAVQWAHSSNVVAYKGNTIAAPTVRKVNSDGTGDTLLGSMDPQGFNGDHWFADDSGVVYLADSLTDIRKFNADGSGNSLVYADSAASSSDMWRFLDRLYLDQGSDIVSVLYDGTDWRNHTSGSSDTMSL